ncbi:hypothetical protein BJ912DRAFT_982951, partial [Pholiota molesta]
TWIWETWMPTLSVALPPVFSPQRLTLVLGRWHWISISFWTRLRHHSPAYLCMHHHQSFVSQEQPKGQRQRVNLKATIRVNFNIQYRCVPY